MLVVYADETGTGGIPKSGGEEPAPGIYGFITTPEKWDEFRIKWKRGLDSHKASFFHFRELRKSLREKEKNPYRGWTDEQADDFIYEMAIIASSGPIPTGANVSQKLSVGAAPDKYQTAKLYRKVFYNWFDGFKITMNDDFQAGTDKVFFYFSEIDNDLWKKILGQVIKDARHHNPLIGEYDFINPRSECGIPCQAADLFAYVNRQNSSKMYEAGNLRSFRLLDLIIARQILKRFPFMRSLAEMPENEWRALVRDMRRQKKEFDSKNPDKENVYYRPIREHPFFAKIAKRDE